LTFWGCDPLPDLSAEGDQDTLKWLLIPLRFGKRDIRLSGFDETRFGPEITRERIFDRSVTARSNCSLMFVCNKTSMPGGGGRKLRPTAGVKPLTTKDTKEHKGDRKRAEFSPRRRGEDRESQNLSPQRTPVRLAWARSGQAAEHKGKTGGIRESGNLRSGLK
jgi:hypothetical protein